MKELLAFGLAGFLIHSSAYAVIAIGADEGVVTDRINIDLPTDDYTYEEAQEFIDSFADWVKEGEQTITFADILDGVPVPGKFQALLTKIVESRDPTAKMLCHQRRCKITSLGKGITFKVDGVSVPILGTPSVTLGNAIEIYAQLDETRQTLEFCRIEGIKVKVGFFNTAVEGGILALENEAIKTLRVDAGVGGDYPTANCDFNPADIILEEEPIGPVVPIADEPSTRPETAAAGS